MIIEKVTEENFHRAAGVYTVSWRESHRHICSPEFLEKRDCVRYLRQRMDGLYMISDGEPVGVFRMADNIIGDLYIHPAAMGKGYGTACLQFAVSQCDHLYLTVLSSNERAIRLYKKMGFRFTGKDTQLREGLWEREMEYTDKNEEKS